MIDWTDHFWVEFEGADAAGGMRSSVEKPPESTSIYIKIFILVTT